MNYDEWSCIGLHRFGTLHQIAWLLVYKRDLVTVRTQNNGKNSRRKINHHEGTCKYCTYYNYNINVHTHVVVRTPMSRARRM